MTTFSRDLVAVAAAECERQHVGPLRVVDLLEGWDWARRMHDEGERLPNIASVQIIASTVEPDTRGSFRAVPVTFRDGGGAAPAGSVPAAMERLVAALDETVDPEEWVRAFLAIHPFTDGNGRTAWVLLHWLKGNFDSPRPLPDFQFARS